MDPILNISDDCIGCGQCVNVCIRGHLQVLEDKRVHEVDSGYTCFRCGHCSSVCPTNAIHLIGSEYGERIDECPVPPESLESLLRQRRSRRWFDRKCTKEEIDRLMSAIRYAPTAENSQKVEYAIIDEQFPQFMELLAEILEPHMDEHPRLEQFISYVKSGQKERNNPFTWEGRQIVIAFARFPIDAIIAIEQLELMAYSMELGGFHSRWMLLATEKDKNRFMSFFPEISPGLNAYAVYVIGHPRIKAKRTVPRDERKVCWM